MRTATRVIAATALGLPLLFGAPSMALASGDHHGKPVEHCKQECKPVKEDCKKDRKKDCKKPSVHQDLDQNSKNEQTNVYTNEQHASQDA